MSKYLLNIVVFIVSVLFISSIDQNEFTVTDKNADELFHSYEEIKSHVIKIFQLSL